MEPTETSPREGSGFRAWGRTGPQKNRSNGQGSKAPLSQPWPRTDRLAVAKASAQIWEQEARGQGRRTGYLEGFIIQVGVRDTSWPVTKACRNQEWCTKQVQGLRPPHSVSLPLLLHGESSRGLLCHHSCLSPRDFQGVLCGDMGVG